MRFRGSYVWGNDTRAKDEATGHPCRTIEKAPQPCAGLSSAYEAAGPETRPGLVCRGSLAYVLEHQSLRDRLLRIDSASAGAYSPRPSPPIPTFRMRAKLLLCLLFIAMTPSIASATDYTGFLTLMLFVFIMIPGMIINLIVLIVFASRRRYASLGFALTHACIASAVIGVLLTLQEYSRLLCAIPDGGPERGPALLCGPAGTGVAAHAGSRPDPAARTARRRRMIERVCRENAFRLPLPSGLAAVYSPYSLSFCQSVVRPIPSAAAALVRLPSASSSAWTIASRSASASGAT